MMTEAQPLLTCRLLAHGLCRAARDYPETCWHCNAVVISGSGGWTRSGRPPEMAGEAAEGDRRVQFYRPRPPWIANASPCQGRHTHCSWRARGPSGEPLLRGARPTSLPCAHLLLVVGKISSKRYAPSVAKSKPGSKLILERMTTRRDTTVHSVPLLAAREVARPGGIVTGANSRPATRIIALRG